MDRQPHRKQNPEFFEPLKIFFAILIVSLVFFAPIVQSEKAETPTAIQEYPALNPFASSADACPWNCIKCTSWDENAWPRTCLTYECMDASGNCGDPGDGGGPSYQPPTISHVLNCSNTGNNGWCIGTLSLDLTASDPQGQSIVISGTVNGVAFACPSGQTTCSIPLPEASGTATYKVDSATGLSANGSTSYHLDVTTPQISGDINGSSGTNGWFISQTSVTSSASDTLSGIATFEVNVDNTGYASYSDTTFTDGTHTIQFRATDNAGNVTETAQQSINVDTTAPTLDLSTTGTTGQNGWYVSAITLTPTANDATSGLYSLEATTDGVTWFSMNAPVTLNDGIYTVQFRAVDQAGNISQTPSQQIKVDATTPSLSLNINGTRGQNDWYISSVTVMPNVSDVGSGVNKIEASVNNGASGTITSPLSFTDGVHSYKIRVTDNAGNFTETPILPMMVDTVPPAIAIYDDSLNLGDTLMYDLEDMMSGLWINRSVIEDEDEKYKKIVWLEEITGKKSNDNEIRWDGIFADGTKAAPGQYFITLKISDQAGNETMRTAIVEVTAFNSILPIPAFTPPVSTVTEPIPSEASTSNEQTFGGGNNGNTGTETTTTNGETVFASVNLQAGGTSSFSNGNQTTSTPISNSNILWGAAAAAVLGATLAEWQKKREEEAARLAALIASNAGQGDEDEIPADVLARRRGKVIANNQAKRAQEQAWEVARVQHHAQQQAKIVKAVQADMTLEEKLSAYKQTAGYIARQESLKDYHSQKAMESHRAGEREAVSIAEEYKAREQEKNMGGIKGLAMPLGMQVERQKAGIPLPGWFYPLVFGLTVATLVLLADLNLDPRSHNVDPKPGCSGTYAECFIQKKRMDYTWSVPPNGNDLEKEQFDEMLDVMYEDMSQYWRTPFDPSRAVYDTPFWNGNARIMIKPKYPDEILCLDGKCSPRSAINYVGVGMYSARVGEPLWLGKMGVHFWNWGVWMHPATPDEIYYFELGYNEYKERAELKNEDSSKPDATNQP